MKKINWFKLIVAIIICELAGVIGSIFTSQSVGSWYLTLQKPGFNPPAWIFGPVWTILFLLMGISLYLVWQKGLINKKALIFFCSQYVLNIGWSFCFFYLQNPLAGFIEILVLGLFILLTIIYFYKISRASAYLLIPYLVWVSFAAVLNFFIYYLNLLT